MSETSSCRANSSLVLAENSKEQGAQIVTTKAAKSLKRTDDEVRQIMLEYFHKRNQQATSRRGKHNGAAVTVSVLRSELKASHGLTAQEVHANLTYLLSHGWVEEEVIQKSFTTGKGAVVPSTTPYYVITAAGIDKIGGPSAFMRNRFEGIKIEATGQNIITIGDGNQIEARYRDAGEAFSQLAEAIKQSSSIEEAKKVDLVADINSMQDQLAKSQPNKTVLQTLWDGIETATKAAGLVELADKVASLIRHLFE
jgi:hypothetical protein